MRIVVVGSGGTGGYFGGLLARAGQDVTFIARGAHLEALRARGLTVESTLAGTFTVPVQATDVPREVGPADLILFCVKTYDTEVAAQSIRPLIRPETIIMSLQNGIGNEERIAQAVGHHSGIGAVAYVVSAIKAPGVIAQTAGPGKIVFGELGGGTSPRTERLHDMLQRAGIAVELHHTVQVVLWQKFLFICAFSGVTAVSRLPIGTILADPVTHDLFRGASEEVEAVARARVAVISQRLAANAGAFVAGVLFGSSVVAVRVAVQEVPPLSLAVLRFGQGGLVLVVVLLLAGMRELLRVKWHDLPLLMLLGALLFTVFPVTFNASLRLIEASRGALVLATKPLWSALLARMVRSERLEPRQVVGVFLSLGGVGLALADCGLGWQGGLGTLAGDGLMFVTALCGVRGFGPAGVRPLQRADRNDVRDGARHPAPFASRASRGLGRSIAAPRSADGGAGCVPRGFRWNARLLPVDVRPARLTPTQVAV
jgi:2-dehydropantoate 2-reductase